MMREYLRLNPHDDTWTAEAVFEKGEFQALVEVQERVLLIVLAQEPRHLLGVEQKSKEAKVLASAESRGRTDSARDFKKQG